MSQKEKPPVFLERASYRRRRVLDAIKLSPVLGLILLLVPLAWSPTAADGTSNASARWLYVFAVWFLLIFMTALLSRFFRRGQSGSTGSD